MKIISTFTIQKPIMAKSASPKPARKAPVKPVSHVSPLANAINKSRPIAKAAVSNNESIAEAVAHLKETKDTVNALLSEPKYRGLKISIETKIQVCINQLSGAAGIRLDNKTVKRFEHMKPVQKTEVTKNDLTPEITEQRVFANKVAKLYKAIDTLDPTSLIADHTAPNEQLVIRGVAKKAGLEDYESADITEEFIDKISAAIKEKAATEKSEQAIEKKLSQQKKDSK